MSKVIPLFVKGKTTTAEPKPATTTTPTPSSSGARRDLIKEVAKHDPGGFLAVGKTPPASSSKKKNKKEAEKQHPPEQAKKRGRPSKAEVEARTAQRLEEEKREKEQIIAYASGTVTPEPGVVVPSWPVFMVGESVHMIQEVQSKGIVPLRGTVKRHDLDSRFVLVQWDDKILEWRPAVALVRSEMVKKKKQKNKI
jgi:hypothetical protein